MRDVLGFSIASELRWALLQHARTNPATLFERRADRVLYNVVGPLEGPRARVARFVSAWQIVWGTDTPWLVTVLLAPKDDEA